MQMQLAFWNVLNEVVNWIHGDKIGERQILSLVSGSAAARLSLIPQLRNLFESRNTGNIQTIHRKHAVR
jgi:hypothetical protein